MLRVQLGACHVGVKAPKTCHRKTREQALNDVLCDLWLQGYVRAVQLRRYKGSAAGSSSVPKPDDLLAADVVIRSYYQTRRILVIQSAAGSSCVLQMAAR